MKIRLLASLAVTAASLTGTAFAGDFTTRIGADYTKFVSIANADDISGWEVGYFGEVGYAFGETKAHSLGLEAGYVESDGDFLGFETKKEQIPVLFNYRYTYRFAKDKFAVFAGPTVGVIHDKFELDTGNPASTGSDSNWLFTYGLTLGLKAQLSTNWSVDASARWLRVEQKEYKGIGSGNLTLSENTSYTRPSFGVSLSYQF